MIRLLIIECLFSALLGAIAFRLAYAFLGQRRHAWVVTLVTAVILGAAVSGYIDPHLLHDFAVRHPEALTIPPWFLQALRAGTYILGAAIAAAVIKKREALGFDHQPPYDP